MQEQAAVMPKAGNGQAEKVSRGCSACGDFVRSGEDERPLSVVGCVRCGNRMRVFSPAWKLGCGRGGKVGVVRVLGLGRGLFCCWFLREEH